MNVSWDDAQAFCAWLSKREGRHYRLPRDWERSVAVGLSEPRDGTPANKDEKIKGVYPWGTQWPPPRGAGNYADETLKRSRSDFTIISGYEDGFPYTSPVGSFAANRFGLFDMGGNVWQWCEDFYDGSSGARVLRGASFNNDNPGSLLSSFRYYRPPDIRRDFFGFRVVVGLGASSR